MVGKKPRVVFGRPFSGPCFQAVRAAGSGAGLNPATLSARLQYAGKSGQSAGP